MSYWPDIQFITGLTLGARFALEPRIIARVDRGLRQIESKWPAKPVDLLGAQQVEGDVRSRHLFVEREEEDGRILLTFDLVFFQEFGTEILPRSRARSRRDLERIDATLEILKAASKEVHIHCQQLSWRFPPGEFDTVITLPLMKFNIPGFPFEDVTGVRFNSSSERQSVIVDRTRDGSLAVTAAFAYHDVIDPNLEKRALEFATNLVRPLIIVRQDEDKNGG